MKEPPLPGAASSRSWAPGAAATAALLLLAAAAAAAAESGRLQSFSGSIDNLAVSRDRLLVASGECWYEVEPSLAGGKASHCQAAAGAVNKLLLPFGEGRLLTCWTKPTGPCFFERLGGGNASLEPPKLGEELVTCLREGSAVGWMYRRGRPPRWNLLVATTYSLNGSDDVCRLAGAVTKNAVSIMGETVGIREGQALRLNDGNFLQFADAFPWGDHFFLPYYHFNRTLEPRVVVLEVDLDSIIGHFGQKVLRCAGGTRILSSVYLEQPGFWIGLFESPGSPTAVCVFDLTGLLREVKTCQGAELYADSSSDPCNKEAWPVNNATLLTRSNLVSVYATVVLNKIVLLLGTEYGQLLKVILDENYHPNCPEVLFDIEEEIPVFHKLELDPLDNDYIYLPYHNKIRRIQVANCSKYTSCRDCLSAMDPHCGWCYLNNSCTLKRECSFSNDSMSWVNISYGTEKCLKIYTSKNDRGEISVTVDGNFLTPTKGPSACKVTDAKINHKVICEQKSNIMNCSCSIGQVDPTIKAIQVSFTAGSWRLSEMFEFNICSLEKRCSECTSHAECTWSVTENKCIPNPGRCKWKVDCKDPGNNTSNPMTISSIEPAWISVLGKSEVLVTGENFPKSNIFMEITGTSSCKPDVVPVTKVLNDTHLKFCLPPSQKEVKSICLKQKGVQCSSSLPLYYVSLPTCSEISPNISWKSGGRKMTIKGRQLNGLDKVILFNDFRQIPRNVTCNEFKNECHFTAPALSHENAHSNIHIVLEVEETSISCIEFQYEPDPVFINYDLGIHLDPELELKIYKKKDNLNISGNEIEVFMSHMNGSKAVNINFTVQNISETETLSIINCRGKREAYHGNKIDTSGVKIYVKAGDFEHEVPKETPKNSPLYSLLLIPIGVLGIFGAAICVTQRKSEQLNKELSEHLELLECDIRKEIREGFVELQMEKLDVIDNFGTIPFLDYKHFVLRTFFPESGDSSSLFIDDSGESLNRNPSQKDESTAALYSLICNKHFLVSLVHTLEKQETFSVKDRCLFASYLTIALQTNLVYLTQVLEILTKDLMEQSTNIQLKLLLRRTESVVEKLLTNWMSVCLSSFIRETFGDPFYSLITTLNQRMIRGPVDVITCKAMYTLNEDWLLWQVPEFRTVALNVVFEEIPENEGECTCKTIQVNVLDCDTVGQAKEKILQAFRNKNGSLYGLQLNEMGLAIHSGAQRKELSDVDSTSVMTENGITKLNTIQHYEILDGATIKVFKKKTDLSVCCSAGEYSDSYCHLILPDSEAIIDAQSVKHKGKQKFKVKEMYLTKLLSTKVAVHSVVEILFRSIWTLPNNKAPVAIKYFFDFLDVQAENKKITDPDVVHIWKTNSLPLRFWVNILKNPQFVFDIKKTPHLDGCLSVIAQAFMDAFSLSEQQLGKEAPTNKLLYAKDIPQYKDEVKAFYKAIKDLPSLSTSELEEFLTQESKKHENEFNESIALTKIYQYIARYFDEILNKLEKERGLEEAQKQLLNIRALVEDKKKCKWV